MDSSWKACCLIFPLFFSLLCTSSLSSSSVNTSLDHKNLVYKHCVNQTVLNTDYSRGSLSEILSTISQELSSQSSQHKFHETSAGDEEIAISGLFQCRNDLSNEDCHDCVNSLPEMWDRFCGSVTAAAATVPARIHLSGCYVRYKAEGFETSRVELQHKSCSESVAVVESSGSFEEVQDGAFAALEKCVVASNDGYCEMRYESMNVMAQCGGNLLEDANCACGECVNYALRIAQDECGYSLSGEVYLDSCFISYQYLGSGGINPSNSNPDNGTPSNPSRKLIAIVLGGAAALGFGSMFFYFYRSSRKRSDDY